MPSAQGIDEAGASSNSLLSLLRRPIALS
jgi:hypothetical protein